MAAISQAAFDSKRRHMEATQHPSEATTPGILTAMGSTIGLALGPSVLAVLTITQYIVPIQKEFGWSRVQVSLAFTIVAYMIVLVSPLQGILADRFGPRRVVLASIPLFAVSLAALYFTPKSLLIYYMLWAIVPVAAIGLWPLGYLQVVSRWFDRKLGLALGVANAGIGLGSTFVPMIVGPIIVQYGWRQALLVLAGLVLFVSWPVVFLFVREPTAAEAAQQRRTSKNTFGLSFAEARQEKTFWVLNIAFFMLGLTATSIVSQQSPLLQEAGWTPLQTGQLLQLFGFGLLFARVAVGFLIDHIFAPRVMMTVSIGGAVACVLYATYPNAAYVSAMLIGFLLGAEFDVLAFLIKRYYGNAAYGKIYGVIFGVFYLGSGFGITALAWCRQHFGNYDTGLFIASGVLVASALLMLVMPAYRFRSGSEQ
jgi:predicted MFS family arabinose efflux permease